MTLLIENSELRQELGQLGTNIVEQFYNEQYINNRLIGFYTIFQKAGREISFEEARIPMEEYIVRQNFIAIRTEQIQLRQYKIEAACHEYEGYSFAWYVLKGSDIIEKTRYSPSPVLMYTFKEQGVYRVRCYVMKGDVRKTWTSTTITI